MQDCTGFQRDCLAAIAGPTGPTGLEVTREFDSDAAGESNHGRRDHEPWPGWESEHVERNG
ncbi:hypothetical protein [Halorientalis regularis]|jgi:hypothetical protein|uniref:Uncharacterized protein n=1 Tax=Halorientalis regularis TaxID=660518 RepID=A0A1G7JV46_9EURY|nr:hypothetical protein [Halorientalis regularis]SDF28674.1 hypothetical protein SAMN05216218_10568 [Halorientalis regularis]